MRAAGEDDLDAWMRRLADGERLAFDPLFRALHPRALLLARRSLPEDQAADAAQAVLLRVFARASDFDAERPVLPWFYAIAANELRSILRRRARERGRHADVAVAEELAAAGDDPERQLLERELRRALDRAVEGLDEAGAEAIAALLDETNRPGIPAPTFRKRVSRAYARLRLLLGGLDAS